MGPLAGLKIVEMAGIGPAPMCAMLLADLGATVLRVDRQEPSGLGLPGAARFSVTQRSRHAIAVDLKRRDGVDLVLRLADTADALIEGFRPGVMERLGLGPETCLARNPRLVYGRMTGWGQEGPLAQAAGHDLNYIALAGVLHSIGRAGAPPTPPLNLVGDFGGGALYLAFGVACGIIAAQRSGKGQVVDAAMVDGAASLAAMFWGLRAAGQMSLTRGENVLDSGAFFYDVYECKDGTYISLAAIEDKFLAEFLRRMEIDPGEMPAKLDRKRWPEAKAKLQARFKTRTREEWCRLLEGSDACFAPVLSLDEAPAHPHNIARGTFVEVDGIVQPAPAPRFSRTPSGKPTPPELPGERGNASLAQWGLTSDEIDALKRSGALT
ncbi:MAG TPA: CaiB/BaiF CoA-transferase family protein [Stellaceae bacterium]|jgi:alpha-methylacyl-CoA racemase|nr:CaiB/BaiF CoA-transferase family protein [Stellaceae bacterium]